MNQIEIEKNIKSYSKYYKSLLSNERIKGIDQRMTSYEKRLEDMYNSDEFRAHNIHLPWKKIRLNTTYASACMRRCLNTMGSGHYARYSVILTE